MSPEAPYLECSKCQLTKPADEFHRSSVSSTRSRQRWCIDCNRSYAKEHQTIRSEQQRRRRTANPLLYRNHELSRYGLDQDQYDALLEAQGGACAICGTTNPGKNVRNFCVDHDHRSGMVRGLLCTKCNRGLGLGKDHLPSFKRAAAYIHASKLESSTATAKDIKWMKMCIDNSRRFSTCIKAQYFSIVIDDETGSLVSEGWNGVPAGDIHCVDGGCIRPYEGSVPGSSYDNCIACHAEAAAILRSDIDKRYRCSIFVNGVPCMDCAALIVHAGFSRLVYLHNDFYDAGGIRALLAAHKVSVTEVMNEDVFKV